MMKRLFLCLAALLIWTATACADTLFVTTQNGKTVNMRSGAGTKYQVLLRVPNGHAVETDDALDPTGWMLCTYNGRRGYIKGQYLSETPGPVYGYAVSGYMATVKPSRTGGYVNLRQKPSKNAKVLYKCYEGDEMIVLRSNGTWCLVYDTGSCDRGFIQSSFLEYGESVALSDISLLLADTVSMIPAASTGRGGSSSSGSGSGGGSQSGAELVYCERCGGWYEAGNVFRNHICSGSSQPEMVYCERCGGWYEAGNVFRNHICSGRNQPEMVQCDLCGGCYEAGNEFRNHICPGKG